MPIQKLEFKPGIHRESTEYAEQGSWYECDKIRFRSGKPEKIGGWVKATAAVFKGVARVLFDWVLLPTNGSKSCLAIGTHKKFYIEESGVFNDITPIRFADAATNNAVTTGAAGTYIHTYTTTGIHGAAVGDFVTLSGVTDVSSICTSTYTNPFSTTAIGSGSVLVNTVVAHYALVGQTVTFSGTTGFAGIPAGDFNTALVIQEVLSTTSYIIQVATTATSVATGGGTVTAVYLDRINREFEVLTVPTTTSFTFQTDTPCVTGAITGGGAACVAKFQISIGFSINIVGGGWGTGTWSRQTWSSPLTSTISAISMRIWSVDNYGEDLVFCTRDGPLYMWDATNGLTTRGVLVSSLGGATDVPSQVSIVRVTEDRHVLAIGCQDRVSTAFDPLLIRWSTQEDMTNWTPAITNTSGAQRIPMGSYVVCALKARQETLIWTDHSLHSLQFTGPPYTFSLQTLAENTGIAGPNAAVNINNITYWMDSNRFWYYSGRVQNLPCDVQRYVFDDLNPQQLSQVYATTNDGFTEVTWYYCSLTSNVIDRYVTFHYEDKLWTIGTLSRSTMMQAASRNGTVYATDGGYTANDGTLYAHEVGYDDGSTNPPTAITAYVESADFDVQSGDKLIFADRVIPDLTFSRSTSSAPTASFTIEAKKFPGQPTQSSDARIVSKVVTSTVDEYTNQVWVRLRGRSMRLKVSSDGLGVCWLLGTPRLNIRLDGRQ
jgi:hypothetical protein